jgi:negative regulator of sigma E activity
MIMFGTPIKKRYFVAAVLLVVILAVKVWRGAEKAAQPLPVPVYVPLQLDAPAASFPDRDCSRTLTQRGSL